MKFTLTIFLFFISCAIFSQENMLSAPIIAVDSLYREDQFYLGFTYNSLFNKPDAISQNKFSSGIELGFLRDMPINISRTLAIAAGLGFSYDRCFHNLLITKANQFISYSTLGSVNNTSKNRQDQYYVDVPLEFRWRTSTPESHEFWRIYAGVKLSYLIHDKYSHIDNDSNYHISGNTDLNQLQFKTYLAFGYNTWNFYVNYGLTPFFKSSAKINGETIGMRTLNLGLMFYIL
ncbi:porin family protein [Flavobacterium luteum]|uniref:PorT family protein n=1 Tax=Flavobacterium luteum TaxID=2026654 RepID=A0A7J5AGJ6_9FLAO|nr:porin family protein [Flavobacterium luteum]KAB1156737.1 PorT family protein [Flavobacterium luteum]